MKRKHRAGQPRKTSLVIKRSIKIAGHGGMIDADARPNWKEQPGAAKSDGKGDI